MARVNVRDRNKNKGRQPNWEYRFEAASIDGRRKQITKAGFRTKKEALEAGTKALAEYNAGGHFVPVEMSVSDYLDEWFDRECTYRYKVSTMVTYKRVISVHLKPAFGKYKLNALSPLVIQEYFNQLASTGLAHSTMVVARAVLVDALEYAVFPAQYISSNPARYVKIPAGKPKEPREPITVGEFEAILEHLPQGNKYRLPFLLGWYCGLRRSEMLGLTWECINFEERTMNIRQQVTEYGKHNMLTAPKRGSARMIKLGARIVEELIAHKEWQSVNQKLYDEYYKRYYGVPMILGGANIIDIRSDVNDGMELNFVCTDENGEAVSRGGLERQTRRFAKKFGKPFNYHCLRHSHATLLIDGGANPKAVQERLGHKDVSTTMQIYVHATQQAADATAEIFEKASATNINNLITIE